MQSTSIYLEKPVRRLVDAFRLQQDEDLRVQDVVSCGIGIVSVISSSVDINRGAGQLIFELILQPLSFRETSQRVIAHKCSPAVLGCSSAFLLRCAGHVAPGPVAGPGHAEGEKHGHGDSCHTQSDQQLAGKGRRAQSPSCQQGWRVEHGGLSAATESSVCFYVPRSESARARHWVTADPPPKTCRIS
eukprot:6200409-Pleurochrysis_carterae.AAC.3